MATAHRRIGVVRDPELAAALEASRAALDPADTRSEAGQVRRLALLGAQALREREPEPEVSEALRRIRAIPGVQPATKNLSDLPWLGTEPVDEERTMSRALEWVRRDLD